MSKSRRPKVEPPTQAEREAAIKARAEAQAKAREAKLEKEADEYEADRAKTAAQPKVPPHDNLNLSQRAMNLAALTPDKPLSELVADSGLSRLIMFEAVFVREHAPNLISQVMSGTVPLWDAYNLTRRGVDQAKKLAEAFAMLQRDAPELAEAIQDERMDLGQAMRELQARVDKQAALKRAEAAFRGAEKRVKELRESAQCHAP